MTEAERDTMALKGFLDSLVLIMKESESGDASALAERAKKAVNLEYKGDKPTEGSEMRYWKDKR